MLTLNFNPFPTITTGRLVLRQLADTDAPGIFILRSDKRVLEFIDIVPANNIEDALAFIHKINKYIAGNECVYWGIASKEDDKLIGTICMWNILKEHYRAEVGFALLPDQQGKGLMSEALAALLNYAFSEMKLHSIEGRVHPGNAASIKLMERNKFVREAYFKEDYFVNGKFGDTAVYSLLSNLRFTD